MRSINRKSGVEGPEHDPYGYTERTMYVEAKKITLHEGLSTWVEATEYGSPLFNTTREITFSDSIYVFEHITGLTVKQFDKAYERVHGVPKDFRCRQCKALLQTAGGHVGEEIIYCEIHGLVWHEPVTLSMIE